MPTHRAEITLSVWVTRAVYCLRLRLQPLSPLPPAAVQSPHGEIPVMASMSVLLGMLWS